MRSLRSVLARRGRVSVAMATFNGETYLPEMLDSLASQTRPPDELVVRDDGSTDRSLDVVHDFASRAPFPVRVVPGGDRLGYAQNFVAASRACTGDLLFFADQDDSWRPEKLETVARTVSRGEVVAVFHDFALQDADGRQIAPSYADVLAERGFYPVGGAQGLQHRRHPRLRRHLGLAAALLAGLPRLLGDPARHGVRPAPDPPRRPDRPPDPRRQHLGVDPGRVLARVHRVRRHRIRRRPAHRPGREAAADAGASTRTFLDVLRRAG